MNPKPPKRGRGNALPETMLVMSLLLMLLFGALNLTLIGYSQIQADGAAFVAARAAALASPSAAPSAAVAQVAAAFPHVKPSQLSVTIAAGSSYTTSALVSMSAPGLPLLFGKRSGAVNITSHFAELDSSVGLAPVSGISYGISSATLKNYVNPTTGVADPTHQAKLAQQINTTCYYLSDGTHNGVPTASNPCWEGYMAFDDQCAHDATYDSIASSFGGHSYSSARTDYLNGVNSSYASPLSTRSSNQENDIVAWDNGTAPSTTGACASFPGGGLTPNQLYVTPDH
ncbi:MAG: TadE/TadG family type IV pilus assembly protein [Vulcanimicrobiaceae bacterium]